jgi:hypothetical protein
MIADRMPGLAAEKMHELRSKFQKHHPVKGRKDPSQHPNNKKRTGVC